MTTMLLEARLPRLREDLVLKPVGGDGRHVVKDIHSSAYFNLGPEESFLLVRLDGVANAEEVREAYDSHFGETLDHDDLEDFVALVRERGLVRDVPEFGWDGEGLLQALRSWPIPGVGPEPASVQKTGKPATRSWNILFVRLKLFDPKWLFDHLEPHLRFVWTRAFLAISGVLIVATGLMVWAERDGFVNQFAAGWGLRTVVLGWLALAVTTALHESAHGLTCKHFGGEVRDMGFLLMYFMPCFYCNVSDAWLISERWKRLWVTLAGGYCDLILWSLGALTWRLTQPGTAAHDFGWFVVSICGFRMLFNVNPLIPLDGYYLLSDLVEVPNLRERSLNRFKGYARWLFWGAAPPSGEPGGGLLLAFGAASWTFSLVFLTLTIWGFAVYFGSRATVIGVGWTVLLGTASARRLFRDFSKGEATAMIQKRRGRIKAWVLAAGCGVLALLAVPVPDRAGGTFQIRPSSRAEIRAPIAGFLREVSGDEGARVSAGQRFALLEVPDLESRLARKQAELRESAAKLRLLEIGPRPEQIEEQRQRVERSKTWRDLARQDLVRTRESLKAELDEIKAQTAQYHAEADRAAESLKRDRTLLARRALQVDQLQESQKVWKVASALLAQSEARKLAREAEGSLKAETELARRESESADAVSALRMLQAGSRPEEVEAEKARLARIAEEIRFLEGQQTRLSVVSPVSGEIATPRLRERIGQYLQEGDLIAEVEAPTHVEAEVSVDEQDVARVQPGQKAVLKVRALPFQTFSCKVDRIATISVKAQERVAAGVAKAANPPQSSSSSSREMPGAFIVSCKIEDSSHVLKTGMTGYARIDLDSKPLGNYLASRAMRLIRTEFWW